jgi:hypothetical protein
MKDEKLMKVAKLLTELASVVNELAEGEDKEVSVAPVVEEKPKAPTLEDVRTVLAEISRSGKTAEMKALLGKFGATRLSEVKAEDYTSLLSAAKELQNA